MRSLATLVRLPPATWEQNWRPTPRWILRRLALYALAAVIGATLVAVAGLAAPVWGATSGITMLGHMTLRNVSISVCRKPDRHGIQHCTTVPTCPKEWTLVQKFTLFPDDAAQYACASELREPLK